MGAYIKKEVDTDSIKKQKGFQKLSRKIAFTSFKGFRWLRAFCFSPTDMELLITVFEKIYSSDMSKAKNDVKNRFVCSIIVAISIIVLIISGSLFLKSKSNNFVSNAIASVSTLFDDDKKMSEEARKAKNDAIDDLKRLGLIGDDFLNFDVESFRKIRLSLKNIDISNSNTINAICQIYAYELAIKDYIPSAIDSYYNGIKFTYDDRYFENKEDFVRCIGFKSIKEYETFALENIENKKGEIDIGGSSMYDLKSHVPPKNNLKKEKKYSVISLNNVFREEEPNQNINVRHKTLGLYKKNNNR